MNALETHRTEVNRQRKRLLHGLHGLQVAVIVTQGLHFCINMIHGAYIVCVPRVTESIDTVDRYVEHIVTFSNNTIVTLILFSLFILLHITYHHLHSIIIIHVYLTIILLRYSNMKLHIT
jgi:hypothetical protein